MFILPQISTNQGALKGNPNFSGRLNYTNIALSLQEVIQKYRETGLFRSKFL